MANSIRRRLRNAFVGGLVSLVAAQGALTTGCSEFNPIFRPSQITSTHKERNLFDLGGSIERMYKSGKK